VSVVRIPAVLRTATGGHKQVEVAGSTIREVIAGLVAAYPGLAQQLLAGDGDLNRFVNVFLNDTDVRHLQALDTPVDARDTVLLLPAMAGGAALAGLGSGRACRHGTHGGPCSCPGRVAQR
jgi:molybdopterin synthase sulfur carrier subunit